MFKAIFLTSYAPDQTFSEEEEQYRWLEKELENVSEGFVVHTAPYPADWLASCLSTDGK